MEKYILIAFCVVAFLLLFVLIKLFFSKKTSSDALLLDLKNQLMELKTKQLENQNNAMTQQQQFFLKSNGEVSKQLNSYELAKKHAEENEVINIEDYVDSEYKDLVKGCQKYLGIYDNMKGHACACLAYDGDIESDGSVELLGTVDGNVTCKGKLVVSGAVTGNTSSSEFFSNNARINGDVNCTGAVKIGSGTVIIGNLSAKSAVIAGAIKGNIDVHGPVIIDSTAILLGDIKSE